LEDLIVNETLLPEEAKEVTEKHGAAIFQNVITKEAAQNLRDYAMAANHELESSFVHSPSHRYHVMPPHTEPTVQEALKQVAEHPLVRPVLDGHLGPSSTVVGVSLVTSEYGAEDQKYHADAETSHASYPDLFVPEYTLAIALQDVSSGMGPTGLCPGTQECNWPYFDWDEIKKQWLKAEKDESFTGGFDIWLTYNMPCNVTADLRQGDALLYNSDVIHRGRAHTDSNAPERALLFIVFAGSRQGPDDTRSLPLGQVHALDWRMWGQTIDDFTTMIVLGDFGMSLVSSMVKKATCVRGTCWTR
jgi:ectoine hydroxylase-related dioxygenase (phytanoyl-CoA dioxygenase family)